MELVSGMVSVVMPVYNAGSGLKESVGSVLQQTYENLELILVDDGSTDGSSEECDRFAASNPRIVVIHQVNAGVSAARNAGIAKARGEYLTFVDADDFLHPDALETAILRLLQDQGDLACFGMSFVHHDGQRVVKRDVKSVAHEMLLDSPASVREHFFELFELNYWSSVCNKVFRTQFVRNNQILFDGRMAVLEDFEFVVKALACNPRTVVLPDALYDYRNDVTTHSSSRRPDIDYLRNFQILDESLGRLAAATHIGSSEQVGQLNAMIFRFYLIGMELLFARAISHGERHQKLRRYAADEGVLAAARSATPSRRGVRTAAACVRARRISLLYLVLQANHWAKRGKALARISCGRARTFLRR